MMKVLKKKKPKPHILMKQKLNSLSDSQPQLKGLFSGCSYSTPCPLTIRFPTWNIELDPLNLECLLRRWRCTMYQKPSFCNLVSTAPFSWPFHWARCWKDTMRFCFLSHSLFCPWSKWWKRRIGQATTTSSVTELLKDLCPSLRDGFKT